MRHTERCKQQMKAKTEHQARKEKYFTNLGQIDNQSDSDSESDQEQVDRDVECQMVDD